MRSAYRVEVTTPGQNMQARQNSVSFCPLRSWVRKRCRVSRRAQDKEDLSGAPAMWVLSKRTGSRQFLPVRLSVWCRRPDAERAVGRTSAHIAKTWCGCRSKAASCCGAAKRKRTNVPSGRGAPGNGLPSAGRKNALYAVGAVRAHGMDRRDAACDSVRSLRRDPHHFGESKVHCCHENGQDRTYRRTETVEKKGVCANSSPHLAPVGTRSGCLLGAIG